jgi:hypothetical protein
VFNPKRNRSNPHYKALGYHVSSRARSIHIIQGSNVKSQDLTLGRNSNNSAHLLFLTPESFNRVTGASITFSNLFAGWPKDEIARTYAE